MSNHESIKETVRENYARAARRVSSQERRLLRHGRSLRQSDHLEPLRR